MKGKTLKRRFAIILFGFAALILGMWIMFQNTVFSTYRQNAQDTILLAENSLLTELNNEFSRMKAVASGIAGSASVQDFLTERDTVAYYEKAGLASEIIRRAAYPHMDADIIATITADGIPYRFTGSVSNDAIAKVFGEARHSFSYSIINLDGIDYFSLVEPVYFRSLSTPAGHVVTLSNTAKIRKTLASLSTVSGIDIAIILDDTVLLSSNPDIEGQSTSDIEELYATVTVKRVTGGNLYAATAITREAYHYGERMFLWMSAIMLTVLLATLYLLYRILSARMVRPLLESADNMTMGLLLTQIDAHFISNTLDCIHKLLQQGQFEKATTASGNFAELLKTLFTGDDEANVFEVIENLNRYIEIMNIRGMDKFIVNVDIDDRLVEYTMPLKILQPLVENAFVHGLGDKTEDCRLTVTGGVSPLTMASADAGRGSIIFEVADNGKGMEPDAIRALQETLAAADGWDDSDYRLKGVALVNIQKRIRARYGDGYGLTVCGAPGKGMTFTVRLPPTLYKE